MEWSKVEIRPAGIGDGVEAEIRGDHLINGDNGCWISIVGWGSTEADARANLRTAIERFQEKTPEA